MNWKYFKLPNTSQLKMLCSKLDLNGSIHGRKLSNLRPPTPLSTGLSKHSTFRHEKIDKFRQNLKTVQEKAMVRYKKIKR
jgi:hypothetical protein